jgi:DNA-binding PadR family transcriptional regulator
VQRRPTLSLNEWAVLGVLVDRSRHGYDIAADLRPEAEIGQVWRVSRQLVYRALERLADLGLIEPRGDEPGDAGPRRTVYAPTRRGRAALTRWLAQPVDHVREVRGALLLKLVLAHRLGVDATGLVGAQRARIADQLEALTATPPGGDPVALWRHHSAAAVVAFLDGLETRSDEAERAGRAARPDVSAGRGTTRTARAGPRRGGRG